MSTWPPPYPRVAHLPPGIAASRDDLVLDDAGLQALVDAELLLEEKLDGANVMVWEHQGRLEAATRGGPGAVDRAGQLGPLRAWVARRGADLRRALGGRVLYGEWLWLRHGVAYDRLADHLVVLDLLEPGGRWLLPAERDAVAGSAGLVVPPVLLRSRGLPASIPAPPRSAFGSQPPEGVVIRMTDGRPPRLVKAVRADFARRSDDAWKGAAVRNALA